MPCCLAIKDGVFKQFAYFTSQCLSVLYTHSALVPTFHRRCYWMLQVFSSCYVVFLSWFLGNYFLWASLTILSHSFHPMCHAFGLEGLHIFLQPWQWGSLSCFLSSVFCLNHNYSCKVSGKEYNLGGEGEGREGKAYHHSTIMVFKNNI